MDEHYVRIQELKIARTIEKLRKNHMEAVYIPTIAHVVPMIRSLLEVEDCITVGGSVTLAETGVMKLLKNGEYNFIDRHEKGISEEELYKRFVRSFTADVFISGVNAITEHGELYFVDGISNRIAPILFGPKKVLIVASYTKIVSNLSDAVKRVKQIAAPANALRLDRDTYCAKNGHCFVTNCDEKHLMAVPAGSCEETLCSNSAVLGRQFYKNRITVIIIGQEAGY